MVIWYYMTRTAYLNATERPEKKANVADFDLSRRYLLASFPVVVVLVLFLGWWVNRSIEEQVIHNTAANVALYVQGFLSPALQGLSERDYLTDQEVDQIQELLTNTPLGHEILSVKVWKEGGLVVYYSRQALVGQRFEPTANLISAWHGKVAGEFNRLKDEEDSKEAKLDTPLLEIYSPVRQHGTERIIAVAEFYQAAKPLAERLKQTKLQTWFVVVVATLAAYGLLMGIVRSGGLVIKRQREALRTQVDQLTNLLSVNENLGERLRLAVRRTTEINEKLLRRVSADLHDGPAQLLSLALLRLDALPNAIGADRHDEATSLVTELRTALQESLTELRHISRGLGLPDLEGLDLLETIERAILAHRRRTRTDVEQSLDVDSLCVPASMLTKLTAYRTVQEALMNAFRHADGQGQQVLASVADEELILEVRDAGPGFHYEDVRENSDQLGLQGLRERIESLGGRFRVQSGQSTGTIVRTWLPLRSAA